MQRSRRVIFKLFSQGDFGTATPSLVTHLLWLQQKTLVAPRVAQHAIMEVSNLTPQPNHNGLELSLRQA